MTITAWLNAERVAEEHSETWESYKTNCGGRSMIYKRNAHLQRIDDMKKD
jgi:hypothetical protein